MSNAQIIQKISDGYTIREIAVEASVNRRTLEDRILRLREMCNCKTVSHLVANYMRRGLIR